MRAEQIALAADLIARRNADAALLARLNGGEALRILLGDDGARQVEIVVSATYLENLRADLAGSFAARIKRADSDLQQMGVEP